MMRIFKDMNGVEIKEGDLLFRKFYIRRRERPGAMRVGLDMMGNERICNDEGEFGEREECSIIYEVKWDGACMIADRYEESNSQASGNAMFNDKDERIFEGSGFHYMNSGFDSTVYEVVPEGLR